MNPIFTGRLVRLAAPDPDKDAERFSKWSQDSEYDRLLDAIAARPWSVAQVREEMAKLERRENALTLMIRALSDDRTIGFCELDGIQWNNGDAGVGIGIGSSADWGKGYGGDALSVLERYAFTELNLFRLSLTVFEYNSRALRCYEKAGFTVEGRSRGFLNRAGRRWDMLHMGILKSEWEKLT